MMSLGVFILVTLIFFSVRSYLIKGTSRFMTTFIYFGMTIISQYITNLMAMHVICKNWQYGVVFFITIIPWVLVFGVITLILVFMPSWLIPFSNTFGFAAAKIAGINKMLNEMMISPQQIRLNANTSPTGMTEDQRKMLDVLYFVTKDPSNIINELTCFASNSKLILKQEWKSRIAKETLKKYLPGSQMSFSNLILIPNEEKLRKMVEFKETVSEAIWYYFLVYTQ